VNWNRGLHYIYIVFALGWIIYTLVISPIRSHNETVHDIYTEHRICEGSLWVASPNYASEKEKCDRILAGTLAVIGDDPWFEVRHMPFFYFLRAVLPPLVLYLILAPICWFIYRGFRKSKPKDQPD
jgi:hypothetical protein